MFTIASGKKFRHYLCNWSQAPQPPIPSTHRLLRPTNPPSPSPRYSQPSQPTVFSVPPTHRLPNAVYRTHGVNGRILGSNLRILINARLLPILPTHRLPNSARSSCPANLLSSQPPVPISHRLPNSASSYPAKHVVPTSALHSFVSLRPATMFQFDANKQTVFARIIFKDCGSVRDSDSCGIGGGTSCISLPAKTIVPW
jgi:hypothetical protein